MIGSVSFSKLSFPSREPFYNCFTDCESKVTKKVVGRLTRSVWLGYLVEDLASSIFPLQIQVVSGCWLVETDHIFYELFRDHPDWLRDFTGLPLPQSCTGSSRVFKQLEIRCDLLLEPHDRFDPHYIVEFQLYHDQSIFNRIELGKNVLWRHLNKKDDCRKKDYIPCEIETVIIFGSKSDQPAGRAIHHPLIKILFIDELMDQMRAKQPESPLLAALTPLKETISDLENNASSHYDLIQKSSHLDDEDREILNDIFLNLLLQRFKTKSREDIRAMIAELTPIKETRVGKELLEEGIERGVEQGIGKVIRKMKENDQSVEDIAKVTGFSIEEIKKFLNG